MDDSHLGQGLTRLKFRLTAWPDQLSGSNVITCHDLSPHFSQVLRQWALPAFGPRIPPRSQSELLCPQSHFTRHARESCSILSDQLFGRSLTISF